MFSSKRASQGIFPIANSTLDKQGTPLLKVLLIIMSMLVFMGFVNLYSASSGGHYFWAQLRNSVITFGAFIVCGWFIPIKRIQENAYIIAAGICSVLLVVLLLGKIAGGAKRWISLGPIGFQPSEFAKLTVAIVVAKFIASHKQKGSYTIRDLLPLCTTVGCIFVLIFLQPDFGTAGMCLIIAVSQLAFLRINEKSIAIILLSIPVAGTALWHVLLRPYQKQRVLNLLNPDLDPQNTGYNSLQSLVAIGSGETFGKGFMQGTQAHLKFLPERHTDFAFSVLAEEHGFIGGALVFFLFAALAILALNVSRQAKDTFSKMLAIGISAFLFFEFTINVAMVLGIFPVVGLPLPFFSYGSSLLLTICVALGLLVSIMRTSNR